MGDVAAELGPAGGYGTGAPWVGVAEGGGGRPGTAGPDIEAEGGAPPEAGGGSFGIVPGEKMS